MESPLGDGLAVYVGFFNLFEDFRGYVEHFVLNDLVTDDFATVRFFKAFDVFGADPLPAGSLAEYRTYMRRSMAFIRARNDRIADYASAELK